MVQCIWNNYYPPPELLLLQIRGEREVSYCDKRALLWFYQLKKTAWTKLQKRLFASVKQHKTQMSIKLLQDQICCSDLLLIKLYYQAKESETTPIPAAILAGKTGTD